VEENILFLESFSSIEIERAYYQELIEYFEISELTGRSARTLSVGQRERTNIVRAFVHQPKIVILDEPGSNLDEALFQKTFAFLEKQARENATQKNISISPPKPSLSTHKCLHFFSHISRSTSAGTSPYF